MNAGSAEGDVGIGGLSSTGPGARIGLGGSGGGREGLVEVAIVACCEG